MMLTERGAADPETADDSAPGANALVLILRFLAALVIVLATAGVLAHFARPSAEHAARAFVAHFGVLGMAFGTLLADGLQFPVPPQFYMLIAIASRTRFVEAFVPIAIASVLAGFVGYAVAERLARLAWISRKTARLRQLLAWSFKRYGYRAALLVSLLPVPYSMLCYLAGLNRAPLRFLGLLALCRIPKLAAFYYLIHVGWSLS